MATMTTKANKDTGAATATEVGDVARWASLWDASTGGTYLAKVQITNPPAALALGDTLRIAAGTTMFTINPGTGQQPAYAIRQLEGVRRNTLYVQYHTGDPGSSGTGGNPIGNIGRIAFATNEFNDPS